MSVRCATRRPSWAGSSPATGTSRCCSFGPRVRGRFTRGLTAGVYGAREREVKRISARLDEEEHVGDVPDAAVIERGGAQDEGPPDGQDLAEVDLARPEGVRPW